MKRTMFIVIICLLICGIKTSYANDIVLTEDIKEINIVYCVSPHQDPSEEFKYNTNDENEIKAIVQYINSFEILDYDYGVPSDTDILYITMYYNDNTETEYRIYNSSCLQFIDETGKAAYAYKINSDEYKSLIEYINSIRGNQSIDTDDVKQIYISVSLTRKESEPQYNYIFSTNSENDIYYIVHYLNSLNIADDGKSINGSDIPSVNINLTNKDNSVDNYGFVLGRFYDKDGKQYKTNFSDYERLVDFIHVIKTEALVLPETITYTPSDWAQNDVDMAIGGGLVPEWNQINYTGDIPRVEVCQLIDNLLSVKGIESAGEENPFSDTNDIAVAALYELGIVDGKSDSEFCPYEYITREEFAKILSNTYDALGLETKIGECAYSDVDDISVWAEEYVNKMYQAGLMCGKDNNEFKPKDSITKEEVIVTLLRLSEI